MNELFLKLIFNCSPCTDESYLNFILISVSLSFYWSNSNLSSLTIYSLTESVTYFLFILTDEDSQLKIFIWFLPVYFFIYIRARTVLMFLQTADQKHFGQYKLKFKSNFINKAYIPISVVYRIILGLYMALSNEQFTGTLIVIAFSIAYIMYNVTNLSFISAYQNYRANLCHITQVVILLVSWHKELLGSK